MYKDIYEENIYKISLKTIKIKREKFLYKNVDFY